LPGCTALETLDLSDTRLGDAGLAALLPALPRSLRTLSLAHNGLTDDGARVLRRALGEADAAAPAGLVLHGLDLSWNALSSSGARALGGLLASPDCPLETLSLDWNALRDRGVKEIGEALKTNTRLKRLSLRYNGIKDAGANGLSAGLRQNRALEELELSYNGVTPAAERKWRAALANKPPVDAAAGTGKGGAAERRATEAPERTVGRAAEDEEEVDEISLDED
jgi:Ran GTPase-activating protein (RanGAP) involved in mRNA processing and transport